VIPTTRSDAPRLVAPVRIRPGVMVQRWERLTFLHWRVEPGLVQRLLPPGLEPDLFDGAAWVGLIPFRLTVGLPWMPRLPWVSTFAEANVRTYVRGADGERGIWFLSLDAERLGAVAVARRVYRLPYVWARMRQRERSGTILYESRRRWPGPEAPSFRIAIAPGRPIPPGELSELERFLICRWRLYSPAAMALPPSGFGFVATQVDHPAWPVRRARAVELRQELTAAAGLEVQGSPLVHFSPGVKVRFDRRRPVSTRLERSASSSIS
jgi:uncharacterized protein